MSILFDKDTQVWTAETGPSEASQLPSRNELLARVSAFKTSLHLPPEKIRQLERETTDQSQSPLWYAARRYRLTASMFGKVVQRLPSTPTDSLVKKLLHSQQFKTQATEWGRQYEPIALKSYIDHQIRLGHTELVATKAGFVVCEEHPFLGASPDAYVHDPHVAE